MQVLRRETIYLIDDTCAVLDFQHYAPLIPPCDIVENLGLTYH